MTANSIPSTQENLYHVIDMQLVEKETETQGSLSIAKSKDFVCIDIIEKTIEHRAHTNKEVDSGILGNISNLKVHVIQPADGRRKSTIKKFYDCMVNFGKQHRMKRQIRRPKRSAQLPVTTHDASDLTRNQDILQAQEYLTAPVSLHSQGYPQEEGDQRKVTRLRGGFDYDPGERSPFVMLVLAITCIMLSVTAVFVGIVVLTPELKELFQSLGLVIAVPAGVVVTKINFIFMCMEVSRRLPLNILLLLVTVVAMSAIAAAASSVYETHVVLQSLLATAIVVAVFSILGFTSFDFTGYLIYVIVISLALTVVSFMFLGLWLASGLRMPMMELLLLLGSTVVQVVLLVIELQMILGGKAVELEEDDYALGAFYLYTSIVNLFIKILAIIAALSEEDD